LFWNIAQSQITTDDSKDVEILYEIVRQAQESSSKPTKALFNSYSKYFRFLSQSATELTKDGTEGLVERFRSLLSRNGIQLVLEGDDSSPNNQEDKGHDGKRPRGRRASFNDTNLDETWISGGRLTDNIPMLHDKRIRSSKSVPRARSVSASKHHYQQQDQDRQHQADQQGNDVLHRRYDRQQMKSTAVLYNRFNTLGKLVGKWHNKTLFLLRRQADLSQIATSHDRQTLLRQSYTQLRESILDNRFWKQQERRAGRARNLFLITKAFTHWAQATSDQVQKTSFARQQLTRARYFHAWRNHTLINENKCRRFGLERVFEKWRLVTNIRTHNNIQAASFMQSRLLKNVYWLWFWKFCEKKAPTWKDGKLQRHAFSRLAETCRNLEDMSKSADIINYNWSRRKVSRLIIQRAAKMRKMDTNACLFEQIHLKRKHLDRLCRAYKFQVHGKTWIYNDDRRHLKLTFSSMKYISQTSDKARQFHRKHLIVSTWSIWRDKVRIKILQRHINDRILLQILYQWVLESRLVLFTRVGQFRQKSVCMNKVKAAAALRQSKLDEASFIVITNADRRLMINCITCINQKVRQIEQVQQSAIEFRNSRDMPMIFDKWKESSSNGRQLIRWSIQARIYHLTSSSIEKWRAATIESRKKKRRVAFTIIKDQCKSNLLRHCLAKLQMTGSLYVELNKSAVALNQTKILNKSQYLFNAWHDRSLTLTQMTDQARTISNTRHIDLVIRKFLSYIFNLRKLQADAEEFVREGIEQSGSKLLKRVNTAAFHLYRQSQTAIAWRNRKFIQHRKDMLRYWRQKMLTKPIIADIDDPESPTRQSLSRRSMSTLKKVTNSSFKPNLQTDVSINGIDLTQFDKLHSSTTKPFINDLIPYQSSSSTKVPGYLRSPSKKQQSRYRSSRLRNVASAIDHVQTPNTIHRDRLDFGTGVLTSTTPFPFSTRPIQGFEPLSDQVTPFDRKLKIGGYINTFTPSNDMAE